MAKIALVKTLGGALVPLTDDDKTIIEKKRVGTVIECDFKTIRNPMFHRKYFALLNLGFDYWDPKGGTVSPAERGLLMRFVKMLAQYGGELQTLQDIASGYLEHLSEHRAQLEIEKSFEAYRKWVIIESGFYDVVVLPNGTTRREAKSISFAKMDDVEFNELYNSSFNVLWNHILSDFFNSEDQVEEAISCLLGFI
ncbi:DUF1367 family protein [Photobacterium damselae subsp. damselae]|uniref:DUF1367 family protein n=1 Tax=Photobacterium damselae TaxID=38293 RepID=UPI000A2FD0C5|nr:DUF1367 family protein [Photobacterium damselae]ARR51577.1 hypothetical protein CAY62_19495 [Photobacterium damselae subsp. damselae]QAY36644.1 DUF1367 family protein [Photobacterium damselae subsp. damselae]QOQ70778.1 DUF1367 family protein [Photobacterium damselae subsp. damselae]